MRSKAMRNLLFGCFAVLAVVGAGSMTANAEEVTTEGAVAQVEASDNYGAVDFSYDAAALKGDATAGYLAGYDSDEGIGLEAYAEANAVAAEVNQSTTVGSDNYNIGYDMGAAVGKADAKGSAALAYEDGGIKIDGEVKAEAIAAEASAGATATVGGVEMGAKATGQVGVGLSAGASYADGKLELEIGAALGLGGKLNITIDASKLINKITGSGTQPSSSGYYEMNPDNCLPLTPLVSM